MPVTTEYCPQRHQIRSAADRDGQGYCRKCRADGARRRRVSESMKLAFVGALESAGLQFEDDDGRPVEPAEAVRQMVELFEAGAL
jgi:hypothetical protein